MTDLSWMNEQELRAVAQGNMSTLSDQSLKRIAGVSDTTSSRSPFPVKRLSQAVSITNPFALPAQAMINATPTEALGPAGAAIGGALSATAPVPFAASLGAGAGQMLGGAEAMRRRSESTGQAPSGQDFKSLALRGGGTAASTAAFAKGGKLVAGGVRNLKNVTVGKLPFVDRVRAGVYQALDKLGERFGHSIDDAATKNPTAKVSIGEAITNLREQIQENPSLLNAVKAGERRANTNVLTRLLADESVADITLQESQAAKQALSRVPSLSSKFPRGRLADYTQSESSLIETKELIREAQLQAFPELQPQMKTYAEGMKAYRLLRPSLKPGSLSKAVTEGGLSEVERERALRILLKENPKLLREIKGAPMAEKFLRGGKTLLKNAALVGTGVYAGRRLFH